MKRRRSGEPPLSSRPTEETAPEPPDWRDVVLSRVRRLIREADPKAVEERKWRRPSNPEGVPVWSHDGILCTGEVHTNHLRLTFAKGASLEDPKGLFNSGFEGNARRAIVLREGDEIDGDAFQELVRAAVTVNAASARR